jgi:hypothetical protein
MSLVINKMNSSLESAVNGESQLKERLETLNKDLSQTSQGSQSLQERVQHVSTDTLEAILLFCLFDVSPLRKSQSGFGPKTGMTVWY